MNLLYQHLQFRAQNNPKDWAIITPETRLNFKQTYQLVNQVLSKITECGVKPGQTVITHIGNKHIDWIVTLACYALGCQSCSAHSLKATTEFDHDWVIANEQIELTDQNKLIEINASWFHGNNQDFKLPPSTTVEEAQRIILTSGPTGTSKAILISQTDLYERITCASFLRGPHAHSLNLMGLSTLSGLLNACANLMLGYPLFVTNKNYVEFVSKEIITLINCTPLQLEKLATQIAGNSTPLKQIRVTGGLIPQPIANLFLEKFPHISLISDYGSSETGLVCTKIINSKQSVRVVGKPYVGVNYEIVNEMDEPIPNLEVGRIRIKKELMPHAYLNDANNKAFRQGWFYPGDLGFVTKTGELAILGRFEDVVNVGGIKLNLNALDEQIKGNIKYLNDAAFFTFSEQDAVRLGVAISLNSDETWEQVQNSITDSFKNTAPISAIIRLPQIPRNHMNKVSRKQLEQIFTKNQKK